MAIKTLWPIILKTLGVWLGLRFLEMIVYFAQAVIWTTSHGFNQLLAFSFVQIVLYGVVSFALLFRTQFLIEKLKVENDIKEEKLELKQDLKAVLRIIIVFLGLFAFVNAFPSFIDQIINHFQVNARPGQSVSFWSYFKPFYLIKMLFGILLIVLNQSIASFVSKVSS